jgi:hypothetical protein
MWLRGVVVLAAIVCALVPWDPSFVERRFSTGVYPLVQRAMTPVSNLLPFALFDLLTLGGAIWAIAVIVGGVTRARRERQRGGRLQAALLLRPMVRLATAAAIVYLAFLALWGFNYRRVPMAQRLVLERDTPAADAVLTLGLDAARRLNTLRADAHRSGWINEPWRDQSMQRAFAEVQDLLADAPDAVPGRLKWSLYGLYFRWSGVDGMVDPFALEVIRNPDLLPWELPFVAAHEWAHLAGYADESEANFVAWLVCLRAGPAAEYSAWMFLYWQISSEVGQADRERLAKTIAEGPRRDIAAVAARLTAGQLPMLRDASWRVYDQYLRANRVEEGIRSYGLVVTLILRARFEDGWTPVRRE